MTNPTLVFYLGAPSADFDQLTWSLRKDDVLLSEHGVMARKPKMYRAVISDRLMTQQLGELTDEDRTQLVSKLSMGEEKSRLILTDSSFLGEPQNMLAEDRLYSNAGRATQELRMLFPDNPVEFMLAIRNPVSMASEVSDRLGDAEFTKSANDTDYYQLKWSEVVSEVHDANPDSAIKVWCYEDSVILWPEILRTAANLASDVPLQGELDHCAHLMSELTLTRLQKFLAERPTLKPHEKRQIIGAFLEKFADHEQVDQDINLPSINADIYDDVCEFYAQDFEDCKNITNVTTLG